MPSPAEPRSPRMLGEPRAEGSGHVELNEASGLYLPHWAWDQPEWVAPGGIICLRAGRWQDVRGAERFQFLP